MALSPARVARLFDDRYDIIMYPRTLADRYYWGFDSEDERADEAAEVLTPLVRDAAARMEVLGRTVWRDIQLAITKSGGVETATVRAEVTSAIAKVKAFARTEWQALAQELLAYEDVDADPGTSRAAMYAPFKQLYRQLGLRVTHPYAAALQALYVKLTAKVDDYFRAL